jgi:hypothetical protein
MYNSSDILNNLSFKHLALEKIDMVMRSVREFSGRESLAHAVKAAMIVVGQFSDELSSKQSHELVYTVVNFVCIHKHKDEHVRKELGHTVDQMIEVYYRLAKNENKFKKNPESVTDTNSTAVDTKTNAVDTNIIRDITKLLKFEVPDSLIKKLVSRAAGWEISFSNLPTILQELMLMASAHLDDMDQVDDLVFATLTILVAQHVEGEFLLSLLQNMIPVYHVLSEGPQIFKQVMHVVEKSNCGPCCSIM